MKAYRLKYGQEKIELPRALIDRLSEISEQELKALLLSAAAEGGEVDPAAAGLTAGEFEDAAGFLRGAGLINGRSRSSRAGEIARETGKTDAPAAEKKPEEGEEGAVRTVRFLPGDRLPDYTSAEIRELLKQNGALSSLIDACEQTLAKTFNPTEVNGIVAMHDTLGLDGGYILTLLAHCAELDKRNVRYAERMACSLVEQGVSTLAALEAELERRKKLSSAEGKLRRLFGMGERALTKKERACFTVWIAEREYPFDLIEEAYEVTVNATRSPGVAYADKVLDRWWTEGIRTAKAARDAADGKKKKQASPAAGSFDTDEFFEDALNRSFAGKGKK